MTPSAVFVENRIVSDGMRQLFVCDIVTDPLGFPTQLSISLYLLPVLRGRFGCDVHVTRFATFLNVRY